MLALLTRKDVEEKIIARIRIKVAAAQKGEPGTGT